MEEGKTPVQQQEQPNWQFSSDEETSVVANAQPVQPTSITWSASEYVAHHKTSGWFIGFGFVLALMAIAIFALTRDMVSTVVVVIIGMSFAAFAGRQPHVLNYAIDNKGIHIGPRTYPYTMFKSFSLVDDGAMRSISLLPMQRFMPPISVYYDPQDEDKIIATLSGHLPISESGHDLVERLMRKVRF